MITSKKNKVFLIIIRVFLFMIRGPKNIPVEGL